jgi:hypothetical protein
MPKQLAITDTPAPRVGTLAPGTGIPVGQKVPEARLRDLEGKEVTLSSLYTKQPILLVFYRGGGDDTLGALGPGLPGPAQHRAGARRDRRGRSNALI